MLGCWAGIVGKEETNTEKPGGKLAILHVNLKSFRVRHFQFQVDGVGL